LYGWLLSLFPAFNSGGFENAFVAAADLKNYNEMKISSIVDIVI